MKRAIHTTLEIETYDWLKAEAQKRNTTLNVLLQKITQFYRTHIHFDPYV